MKLKLFWDIVRHRITSTTAPIVVTNPVSTVNLIIWFKDALERRKCDLMLALASWNAKRVRRV